MRQNFIIHLALDEIWRYHQTLFPQAHKQLGHWSFVTPHNMNQATSIHLNATLHRNTHLKIIINKAMLLHNKSLVGYLPNYSRIELQTMRL